MTTLLVTATGESTGKTAIAIALGRQAKARGRSVGYMKPKGTRLQSHVGKTIDRDPMLARELLGTDDEMHEMEPIVYSPTFVRSAMEGRERPDELRERVREGFDAADEADPDRVAANAAVSTVLDLCTDVGLATYLEDFGDVPDREAFLDVVPEMAQDAIDSGSPANNPRKPTKEEIEELFVQVYDDALAADSPRRS